MRAVLVLAVVSVLVAGCLGSGNDPKSELEDEVAPLLGTAWVNLALTENGTAHDHKLWEHHVNMSTPNFVELAHDPLGIPAYGNKTAGGYFCGGSGVTEEGRHLTAINSFDTNIAFSVIDTTDPAAPKHVGDYFLDYAHTYDIDMTPDGRFVVIGANFVTEAQPEPQGGAAALANGLAPDAPTVTSRVSFRDACTGKVTQGPDQTFAAGPSTILVSIEDPTMPTFADIVPAPIIGPHSVSTALIDGRLYAASSITNLVHAASYYHFFEIVDLPSGGAKLQLLSTMDAAAVGQTTPANGHMDAEIALHPVTNSPVVYLSNWGGGMVVLDFSVPQAPVPLGAWADTGPSGGAMHSTLSLPDVHNGRHYVLAGQEFIGHPQSGRPTGWIYILDDTDPSNVVEVGRWTLPIDTQGDWGGVELFSTHYFRVLNDTAFVAMYHGGVWAFHLDFANPENMKEPRTLGVFLPAKAPQDGRELDWGFAGGFYNYAPFVLDLFVFPENKLVVYDSLTGVYSVEWHPEVVLESPPPWPVDGET